MFYKIWKPKRISSFKAIKDFAKEMGIKKIGHSGTLDPLADGLLIIATDEDTKLLNYIVNDVKTYYVKASLHKSSRSYDEGEEIFDLPFKNISKSAFLDVLSYIKDIKTQIPPIFSAKKINGVRLYKLARENRDVEIKPIDINILDLSLINFDEKHQTFEIETTVSKGTYIRSLIHDIGVLLNTDAIVNTLTRLRIGDISMNEKENFIKINDLEKLFHISLYMLEKNDLVSIAKNRLSYIDNLSDFSGKKIFIYNNEIIGIGDVDYGKISFSKVLFARIERILKEVKHD
ncbi:tRNA pseudouridine synthase B [Metamycoplasma cloacale]|uniref:tRNA pseudouridine(55) synthase n=1 Tax=Metamycoplasma cloacale TaxID=92401 RepID=A0A2Z4LM45_9BACT|nr:tRNA pseudouridine(55) synthase TruB [Metamycoplasma cloacale]AWX42780.1 tRNA pseudouridine(55) synthase TruB [Metamycoplasma cloacale]VEU79404.1 tRNA pseudouridine synthase B [Metamycoplasma cloacale]